jgi:hypothetical protein
LAFLGKRKITPACSKIFPLLKVLNYSGAICYKPCLQLPSQLPTVNTSGIFFNAILLGDEISMNSFRQRIGQTKVFVVK